MTHQSIAAIAAHGMDFERNRLELATAKISLANATFSSLLEAETFANSLHINRNELLQNNEQTNLQIKSIMDKKNPQADSEGYVYKFDIDPTHEMATLVSATRAYEANVRAYNANSQMTKAALDIGSK
jgi:flagellar basal-body rod protein FlgC